MKAIQIKEHGNVDVLRIVDLDEPVCLSSQVKIQIKAASLNHLDIWVRKGFAKLKLPLPLILGSDASGTIIEIGSKVDGFNVGDDIIIQPGVFDENCPLVIAGKENFSQTYGIIGETQNGVQSEFIVLDPINIYKKPNHLNYIESSSMSLVFMTAYEMVIKRAKLAKNEIILVYGATSGIGSAAIQISKDLGAKIITTVGSDDKVQHAYDIGADYVVVHSSNKYYDEIIDFLDGGKVDVVFEHVGLKTWKNSLCLLNHGGRVVTCGATTGHEVKINLLHLFMKQQSILGSTMGSLDTFRKVMSKIENKIYKPCIDKVYIFDDIKLAHKRLEDRKHIGKIVLTPK